MAVLWLGSVRVCVQTSSDLEGNLWKETETEVVQSRREQDRRGVGPCRWL